MLRYIASKTAELNETPIHAQHTSLAVVECHWEGIKHKDAATTMATALLALHKTSK